jgi:hypothetical protein
MSNQFLCNVPVSQIIVDPVAITPSAWDRKAIQRELNHFIRANRYCNGTPHLRLTPRGLLLLSGEPFVSAVREADLPNVICLVEAENEKLLADFNAIVLSPSQALQEQSDSGRELTMIFFERQLTASELVGFSEVVSECFQSNCHIESFHDRSLVTINKIINPEDNLHRRFFQEAMEYPISSVNGISILN